MTVTASPHLSRPLRYAGRWVVGLGTIGTVYTQEATVGGTIAALILGAMAAAAVHIIFGSPAGRPSLREVAAAVRDLGVDAQDLRPAELQPAGMWTVLAEDSAGEPLVIKVYGRDAWDTQLVTQAWRFLWYRHSSARFHMSRESQVEHEALLLLLARTASVHVPMVRAVGRAPSGDTILAIEPVGDPGAVGALDRLWAALHTAHDAGLSPCSIDLDDLGWTSSGDGVLSGWSGGMTAPTEMQCLQDRAQLLVATTLISGRDAAIDAARAPLSATTGWPRCCRTCRSRRCLRRCVAAPTTSTTRSTTSATSCRRSWASRSPSSSSCAGSRWAPSCRPRCSCSLVRRSSALSPGSTSTRWPTRSRPSPWAAS